MIIESEVFSRLPCHVGILSSEDRTYRASYSSDDAGERCLISYNVLATLLLGRTQQQPENLERATTPPPCVVLPSTPPPRQLHNHKAAEAFSTAAANTRCQSSIELRLIHGGYMSTFEYANVLRQKPESLRSELCRNGSVKGVKPIKLTNNKGGRLLWPRRDVEALLSKLGGTPFPSLDKEDAAKERTSSFSFSSGNVNEKDRLDDVHRVLHREEK